MFQSIPIIDSNYESIYNIMASAYKPILLSKILEILKFICMDAHH